MILTDNETKLDLLNNEAVATTIIELLRSKPDHPVTIGVHGDWGAGIQCAWPAGADMQVSLVNDGPVTLTLDSQNLEETHMWYVSYSRIPR